MKTQQAPFPVQSSFEFPTKLASKINQFSKGGIDFISINKVKRVNTALKLLELIFLFSESNEFTPLNSILIRYNPTNPIINGEK
tara:strand:+ start:428 stop:679 length:252 start_codon:yes stop_codon:yes gene_type:complete